MDETGLSAGSGPEGRASGSAAGRTSGEVTPDEEAFPVSPEEEAAFVSLNNPEAVHERGDGQENFSEGPHPELDELSPDEVALVDAPASTDPPEGEVHEVPPEELRALADEADLSPEVVDEKGFDESDDPDLTRETLGPEGDRPQPGGP